MGTMLQSFGCGFLVTLTGRMGADPKYYDTGSTPVLSWSLATNIPNKDKDKEITEWISCVSFGKDAEMFKDRLAKGDLVACMGSLRTSRPRDGEDKDESKKVVFVTTLLCVQKRQAAGEQAAAKPEEPSDDLPF